jgi:glycosyltransferase involved in cell wall biosynthesis
MAQLYARGGDEVVWFNNTFDHYQKKHRFAQSTITAPEPNLTLVGLQGRAYTKNVSLRRILHHRDVEADWWRITRTMPKPDVIVASMPPLELSRAAVRYGEHHGVPVIVDIRDLWPDIFLEVFPQKTLWAGRFAVSPFYNMLRESVRKSSAISGVSEYAVDWALGKVGRRRGVFDGALPLAYSPSQVDAAALAKAGNFWDAAGVYADQKFLTVCFFGSLTPRIELDTVFTVAQNLSADMQGKVRIVVCGIGQRAGEVQQCASQTPFLISGGWINAAQIAVLMQRSQIGLLPYPSSDDFTKIIPNKVFDYLSGGLPILTCLTGATGNLVTERGVGWMYRNGDAGNLARMLLDLSNHPEHISLAAARSAEVAKEFSAEKIYGEFRDRLIRIIAAGSQLS